MHRYGRTDSGPKIIRDWPEQNYGGLPMAGPMPEHKTLKETLIALYDESHSSRIAKVCEVGTMIFEAVWASAQTAAKQGKPGGTFALTCPPETPADMVQAVYKYVLDRFREGRIEAHFQQSARGSTITGIVLLWRGAHTGAVPREPFAHDFKPA
jgi:hypothetical protein